MKIDIEHLITSTIIKIEFSHNDAHWKANKKNILYALIELSKNEKIETNEIYQKLLKHIQEIE